METTSTQHSHPSPDQETTAQIPSSPTVQPEPEPKPMTLQISNKAALSAAWHTPRPLLTHLNADTTWVLHIPYPEGATPPPGRSRFNVLLDPWLQGPQSDGGRWFSIQWHVVAPSVQTIQELDTLLRDLETGTAGETPTAAESVTEKRPANADVDVNMTSYIDAVAISHEFTDHCHEATLRELPRTVPVLAPSKAAKLIRSWKHFDLVVETPAFSATTSSSSQQQEDWRASLLSKTTSLPHWLGIGRVVTPGNALYYHSALIIAWEASPPLDQNTTTNNSSSSSGQAIIYSPHGIEASALQGLKQQPKQDSTTTGEGGSDLQILALLHGLDDIRLTMTKQLNLGGVNGVAAARACGARYWVATHDEAKKGGGFVSLLLRRRKWSVADAVESLDREEGNGNGDEQGRENGSSVGYQFVEMGSGDALVLV